MQRIALLPIPETHFFSVHLKQKTCISALMHVTHSMNSPSVLIFHYNIFRRLNGPICGAHN